MSFQAYLDNIEEKTGKTPREFMALATELGYDAGVPPSLRHDQRNCATASRLAQPALNGSLL